MKSEVKHTVEFLIIRTSPFFGKKNANFRSLIHLYTYYYSIVRTAKCKHGEITFLTSRSVSKHVLFALGVNPTAWDASEGGGSDLVS